jgi:hypothetical protein
MLAVKKTKDGFIYSYVDYRICNEKALDDEKGIYCYVRDVWIHPKYERKNLLKQFIKEEHKKFPQVIWLYFKRKKYGGRMKMFEIKRLYEV